MRRPHGSKPSRHVPSHSTSRSESSSQPPSRVDGFIPRFSWRLALQREAFFAVQLLLIFGVSFTAMQISRDWLSANGLINAPASAQNARIFWPSNMLTLFPQPARLSLDTEATAAVILGKTSAAAAAKTEVMPARSTQVAQNRVNVTRTPRYTSLRVQQATRNPYAWAPTRRAPAAKLPPPRVRQAPAPRIAAYTPTPYKAAAKPPGKVTPASRPIRRILREDYQVPHPQQSYSSYMKWVRETLQEYKPGS